jgi:predicted proteasome-type protease
VFRKLHYWRKMGERVVVLLSAGNLAVTQSVISILNEQLVEELSPGAESLFTAPSLYRAARLVGDAVRQVHRVDGPALEDGGTSFNANFILGGAEVPRLFHIYPEGNFIEATGDTPFFQIDEHKYGKPIIDRVVQTNMRLGEAGAAVVRFDLALEPFGRIAHRPADLRARLPRRTAREAHRAGGRVFPQALRRLVGGVALLFRQDGGVQALGSGH